MNYQSKVFKPNDPRFYQNNCLQNLFLYISLYYTNKKIDGCFQAPLAYPIPRKPHRNAPCSLPPRKIPRQRAATFLTENENASTKRILNLKHPSSFAAYPLTSSIHPVPNNNNNRSRCCCNAVPVNVPLHHRHAAVN